MTQRSHHELRCFCSREPLLATYGLDAKGKLYVHVRVYKQRRVFGEVLVTDGRVQLHCRECLRWHTVVIRQPDRAALVEDTEPPVMPDADDDSAMLAAAGDNP